MALATLPTVERDALIEAHMPVARQIACWLSRQDADAIDDAISVALVALVEVAQRYDPQRGASFKTFASRRMIGAIRDWQRSSGLLSRRECAAVKQGAAMPFRRYVPIDEASEAEAPAPCGDPVLSRVVARALDALPRHEREMIQRRYWQGHSNAEIGAAFGRSECWSSWLHRRALARLRDALRECA